MAAVPVWARQGQPAMRESPGRRVSHWRDFFKGVGPALADDWPGKLVTKQIFRRVYGKLLGKACVKSSKKRKNKRMKLNISSLDELLNLAYSDDLLAVQLLPILPIR